MNKEHEDIIDNNFNYMNHISHTNNVLYLKYSNDLVTWKEMNKRQETELNIYSDMLNNLPNILKEFDKNTHNLDSNIILEYNKKSNLVRIDMINKIIDIYEYNCKTRVVEDEKDEARKIFEEDRAKEKLSFILKLIYDALHEHPNCISVFDSIEELYDALDKYSTIISEFDSIK
jgi:hypothetical protein